MGKIIIMGAGPAGLTSGYILKKNNKDVILLEADGKVGGISKTIKYKDYYFDLGGHRFFTKIKDVQDLWFEILENDFRKTPRLSRIYYNNKFFNYPLTAKNALFGLGLFNTLLTIMSYFKSKLFPYKKEETFEQWVSNRFGKKLYTTFFKTYTEKVWGIPCSSIKAEWASQRIKGLSLKSAILNALFKSKKNSIKTLIKEFYYPIYGPGMMYTSMENRIKDMNGKVFLKSKVDKINRDKFTIKSIEYIDEDGKRKVLEGSHFISSIPITELVQKMNPEDEEVKQASQMLHYRSLITVDIIVNKKDLFPDNWIYIHSPEVKLGRIQNFKNWSKEMVPNNNKTSLGLEYFCDENDDFWNMSDEELFQLASREIEKIDICKATDIEDYTVVRVPKAYPVYMKDYDKYLNIIIDFLGKFKNLQMVGRYGLFKYNNMDHSILTGIYAAKNIIENKAIYNTLSVNSEDEYHESKNDDNNNNINKDIEDSRTSLKI